MGKKQKETEMTRRVIVNADDFGLNERNSRAIADAFDRGLITETTMLANGRYFDEAAQLARERGFIERIGVHLNLTEDEPLTEEIKSCPRFVADGCFNKVYNRQRTSPLTAEERDAVYRELTAQVKKIQSAGIRLTHADSHHHIHTGVFIAPIAVQVCRENGIDKIRLHRNMGQIPFYKKIVKTKYNRWLRKQGFITTDFFAYVMDIRDTVIPDNTEIMVHPDYDRDGVLIDRRGMEDGMPIGYALPDFHGDTVDLRGYADLKCE